MSAHPVAMSPVFLRSPIGRRGAIDDGDARSAPMADLAMADLARRRHHRRGYRASPAVVARVMTGKNRIMIYGPKDDGTYVVEFKTADGAFGAKRTSTGRQDWPGRSKMTQSGHRINRYIAQLRAPIPVDMFVKFLQRKHINPAFARWRIDAEVSYRAYSRHSLTGGTFPLSMTARP